jgi:hypothetical protein
MLETAMLTLRSSEAGAVVRGRVKAANAASRRVFEGLGFGAKNTIGTHGEGIVFSKAL